VGVQKLASGWEPATLHVHAAKELTEKHKTDVSRVAAVREQILATAVENVLACSRAALPAVVVGGSVGREEHTILLRDGRAKVLGDAEFFLICSTMQATRQFRGVLDSLAAEIEAQLSDRAIDCHITCSAMSVDTLRKMSPHILGLELRQTGKVLWGDPKTLELIPPFSLASIPRWDAWRSVSNRMIEQLDYVDALWNGDRSRLVELVYWTLKIQLELATVVLLFSGVYRPTYRERAEELERLHGRLDGVPWATALANRVVACTEFKLNPNSASSYADFFSGAWETARELAFAREEFLAVLGLLRGVWLWGAEQLIGRELERGAQPLEVGLEIALRQDWRWRARGWARLGLAERDWLTIQGWARFLRLSLRGSPRFLLYAVSAALYFAGEDWLTGKAASANQISTRALQYLPFAREQTTLDWPKASRIVVRAWNHFLRPSWA
jgi:hypothetical protein